MPVMLVVFSRNILAFTLCAMRFVVENNPVRYYRIAWVNACGAGSSISRNNGIYFM
jgi:hypothetical protein